MVVKKKNVFNKIGDVLGTQRDPNEQPVNLLGQRGKSDAQIEQERLKGLTPTPTPTQPKEEPKRETPPFIINSDTGEVTGVNKDGETFLGLDDKTIEAILKKRQKKQALLEGAQEQNAGVALKNLEQDNLSIAQGVGQLTPEQQALNPISDEGAIDTGFAIAGGLGGALAGGGSGAAVGASVGAGIGFLGGPVSPLTVPIAAGVGVALGATIGVYKAISGDKRNNVEKTLEVYKGSKTNMAWIINNVNAGKLAPQDAQELWNIEIANLYAAERNIKSLTDDDLDRFLSGGAVEATRINAFLRRVPNLNLQLQQAMLQPNPAALAVSFADPEDFKNE